MTDHPYSPPSFLHSSLLIDIDLAAVAKAQGCHDCQGPLHQAHYPQTAFLWQENHEFTDHQ